MSELHTELRFGWSTGACATALAVAAWHKLCGLTLKPQGVPVLFGDGIIRNLPVQEQGDFFHLIKDGGDDPDCTHKSRLFGRMTRLNALPAQPDPRDIVLTVGHGLLVVHSVEGIGLCTRPGLDCEPGKWAINIGPRRMMAEHLGRLGFDCGVCLFELGIYNGEKLAEKTLNARLGVVGGLSVLGTTGLVRPFSHEAWIATVRLCARSLAAEGQREVVLCTGGRTTRGAQALPDLKALPATCFISMGDFLAESLLACQECNMSHVTIACMPGKLCKYAAGYANTHAHKVPQDMALFSQMLYKIDKIDGLADADTDLTEQVAACASVREALLLLTPAQSLAVLNKLASMALHVLRTMASTPHYRILVFDFTGNLLLDTRNTSEVTTCPAEVPA